MKEVAEPILVLGGDGYLGWPLALALAQRNFDRRVVIVDNGLRRKLVREVGGASVLPIHEPERRLAAAREIYQLDNLEFINMDVYSASLNSLIREYRPVTIYHLAQQCSAAYSMRGPRQALFTLNNNEGGNMRLLWAVKQYAPQCHIVKLGSFGEYAKSGIDVAEGYFQPEFNGKKASRPVPYPRQSDDFYHVSKINDTNYISVACRKWGLRITDVMQSTVFGCWTPQIADHGELYTRMDYDECFGTVVNRFMVQALYGEPLTVYGSGRQTTGLMALNDSVASLAELWKQPPPVATHKVINHLTEYHSINEIAEVIRSSAAELGLKVEIQQGVHDPRAEGDTPPFDCQIERHHVTRTIEPSGFVETLKRTMEMLNSYRRDVRVYCFSPTTIWDCGLASPRSSVEKHWEFFRQKHFPSPPVNLNPGTFGTPSQDVMIAMRDFATEDLLAQPLSQYIHGKNELAEALKLAEEIWPSAEHKIHAVTGASQCSNLMALALARRSAALGRPLRILTTKHEHVGGIGAFRSMSEFDLHYLTPEEKQDNNLFEQKVSELRPDCVFFSHVTYDLGQLLPVENWARIIKNRFSNILVVIDISQSLGFLKPPFNSVDALFSSGHKWLFGPRGSGLLWTNELFRDVVEGLYWGGEPLCRWTDDSGARFGLSGGVDFSVFAGLKAALELYRETGEQAIYERSSSLNTYFAQRFGRLLNAKGIRHQFHQSGAILAVCFDDFDPYPLYSATIDRGGHFKCIIDDHFGESRKILRFGFPYYETEERLAQVLAALEENLERLTSVEMNRQECLMPVALTS